MSRNDFIVDFWQMIAGLLLLLVASIPAAQSQGLAGDPIENIDRNCPDVANRIRQVLYDAKLLGLTEPEANKLAGSFSKDPELKYYVSKKGNLGKVEGTAYISEPGFWQVWKIADVKFDSPGHISAYRICLRTEFCEDPEVNSEWISSRFQATAFILFGPLKVSEGNLFERFSKLCEGNSVEITRKVILSMLDAPPYVNHRFICQCQRNYLSRWPYAEALLIDPLEVWRSNWSRDLCCHEHPLSDLNSVFPGRINLFYDN